jgi:hypothetical protein
MQMPYPLMFRLVQKLHNPTVGNVPDAVDAELSKLKLGIKVKAGETIAITCGSRAIANYAAIIKAVVDHFKSLEAIPFLVPAMGSHGGGTAEGQRALLHTLGITEEVTGAEIRCSMDATVIGHLPEGVPVYCDQEALKASHTVVVNRVNLHSRFHNDVQSGLLKMMAMGLGKVEGARLYHQAAEDYPLEELARGVHRVMLGNANILAGLMVVDNSREQTAHLLAALPQQFIEKEKAMLQYSRELFPSLPFRFIDILLVDEIGTSFSPFGADPNVTGRSYNAHAAVEGEFPKIRTVIYRDLRPNSHGNAVGVGHAEFVRSRLVRKIDPKATKLGAVTARMPTLAAIPIDFETDREILDAALTLTGLTLPENARIVWIPNTANVCEMECSEVLVEEVRHWKDLSVVSGMLPLNFDTDGNLRDYVVGDASSIKTR